MVSKLSVQMVAHPLVFLTRKFDSIKGITVFAVV